MTLHSKVLSRPTRLLLVDDDPAILETTAALLEPYFRLTTALGGPQALGLLEHQAFDCVCTDFSMPGLSGVELLQRVAQFYPQTMGVLTTGFREQLPPGARSSESIFGILYKPYDIDSLVQMILDAVRTRSMRSAMTSFAENSTKLGPK